MWFVDSKDGVEQVGGSDQMRVVLQSDGSLPAMDRALLAFL